MSPPAGRLYEASLVGWLTQSLAFRMSLASKELFHSNLLAYAIERDPALLSLVGVPDAVAAKVSREVQLGKEAVIDLVVEATGRDGSHAKILVEIKLKSLPTVGQLTNYATSGVVQRWLGAGEQLHFALIAPVQPQGGVPPPWKFVPFEAMFHALASRYEGEVDYEARFFYDYAQAFKVLTQFVGRMRYAVLNESERTTWSELLEVANHADFGKERLRIYDLVYKVIFDGLAAVVSGSLPKAPEPWAGPQFQVALAPSGRAGVLDIRLNGHPTGKTFGIQIEGKYYRHFVAGLPPSGDVTGDALEWLNLPADPAGVAWRLLPLTRSSRNDVAGAPRSYRDGRGGTRFAYHQAVIPDDVTVHGLSSVVAADWTSLVAVLSTAPR